MKWMKFSNGVVTVDVINWRCRTLVTTGDGIPHSHAGYICKLRRLALKWSWQQSYILGPGLAVAAPPASLNRDFIIEWKAQLPLVLPGFMERGLRTRGPLLKCIYLWLYSPFVRCFLILCTVLGRVIDPSQGFNLHTEQHKHRINAQTSMPWVGFEPTTPVFEPAKTVHALDRAAGHRDRLY
jgi:hypothetical protein